MKQNMMIKTKTRGNTTPAHHQDCGNPCPEGCVICVPWSPIPSVKISTPTPGSAILKVHCPVKGTPKQGVGPWEELGLGLGVLRSGVPPESDLFSNNRSLYCAARKIPSEQSEDIGCLHSQVNVTSVNV